MHRSRIIFAFSCLLCWTLVSSTGCKKSDDKAPPETKPTDVVPETPKTPQAPVDLPPLEGDIDEINATLEALADATLAQGAKPGDEGGLPPVKGEAGIACRDDAAKTEALAHIGFDVSTLKKEVGFRYINVCLGWRPFIKPVTEIYWMISAGSNDPETGLMAHRRCLRVRATEDGLVKDPIIDGACLEMHRASRARAEAATKAELEEAAKEAAKKGGGDKAAPKPEAKTPAPSK